MFKFFYNLYALFIGLPLFILSTFLTATTNIIGATISDPNVWGYYPAKIWSILTCKMMFLPVKIEGRENIRDDVSYVFVANHQSAFDIWIIYGYIKRNFKWMMKQGIRKIPFVGKACETAGHIFVDRSSPSKVKETIDKAYAILQGGTSLVVFPEGSRSENGHLQPFKRGAFLLADDLQMQVVPMTINGAFDVLPKNRKYLSWHPLTLTIHKPIAPIGKGPENIKHLMEASREAIYSNLDEKYKP